MEKHQRFKELIAIYLKAKDDKDVDSVVERFLGIIGNREADFEVFRETLIAEQLGDRALYLMKKVGLKIEFVPEASPKDKLGHVVYRGTNLAPDDVYKKSMKHEFGTKSVFRHKLETGSSIYISTSRSLKIALEHACRFNPNERWVYKIDAAGGICTRYFMRPVPDPHEEEVIFESIKLSQVIGVGLALDENSMKSGFLSLEEYQKTLVTNGCA